MYSDLVTDIYSIFATESWLAQNIDVYPDNYQGSIRNKNEYCRLKLLPSESKRHQHGGGKNLSGLIALKIFVKAGEANKRLAEISSTLDTFLENKKLSKKTELGTSYLSIEGLDAQNQSLYSASYFINFNLYGE